MDDQVGFDLGLILRLPALRTIDIENLPFRIYQRTDLQTYGLRHLNVKDFNNPLLGRHTLFELLRTCGNLNQCSISVTGLYGPGYWGGNKVLEIFDALLQSRESLQELVLDLPTESSPTALGNIAQYSRLVKLQLPLVMVLTPNLDPLLHQLPPCLDVLALVVEGSAWRKWARAQLGFQPAFENQRYPPSLTKLIVLLERGMNEYEGLVEACKSRGILFTTEVVRGRERVPWRHSQNYLGTISSRSIAS
jgi:hypothetical protein